MGCGFLPVPDNLTHTINRMLEANASLLDDETSAIFTKIFGGGQVVDREYVAKSATSNCPATMRRAQRSKLMTRPSELSSKW